MYGQVVQAQLEQNIVTEKVPLAVPHRKNKDSAVDYQADQRSGPTGPGDVGVGLVELKVQLEKGLVDEDSHHFVQIPSLIQQVGPAPHLLHQIGFHELHALGPPVPVEDRKEANEFPLASSHVLLHDHAVLHGGPKTDVVDAPAVEPVQLEHEVPYFELVVEGEGEEGVGLDFAEDLLVGDELPPAHLGDGPFGRKDLLRVVAEEVALPPDLNGKVSQRLVEEINIEPPVDFVLSVPLLNVSADPNNLLHFLFAEGVVFEVVVLGRQQLRNALDPVVLKEVAQIGNVVGHADLFDLVDRLGEGKAHHVRADSEFLPVLDLHSLLGNVHPRPFLALVVQHVKVLEAVELELDVLRRQFCPLYLESEPEGFGVPRAQYFPVFVRGDIKAPIFVEAFDAVEDVLQPELLDLCDVEFLRHQVVVVLFDEIHFVFDWPGGLLLADGVLFGAGLLPDRDDGVFGNAPLGHAGLLHLLCCFRLYILVNDQPIHYKTDLMDSQYYRLFDSPYHCMDGFTNIKCYNYQHFDNYGFILVGIVLFGGRGTPPTFSFDLISFSELRTLVFRLSSCCLKSSVFLLRSSFSFILSSSSSWIFDSM